jgi:PAS domain S-box-containing protein/putative nucleotidyltransferase with HDIG domain
MDSSPLYNSRIFKNYIEFLRIRHPDIDITYLLAYANMEMYQVDDEGHWFVQEQINRFHEILAAKTSNPDIAREVGRFSVFSRGSGAAKQYLMGFINPEAAYAVTEKINASFSRAAVLKTKPLGTNKMQVTATLIPNAVENPYQCDYRLGALESVAKIFTGEFAKIEHPVCLHNGGDCCRYIISWKTTRTFFWKKIRNYSFVLSLIACLLFLKFLPPHIWDGLVLSCILAVMSIALYTEHLEKRELFTNVSNQGDAASRLLDQINVSYNNALLVQEIGQATSMILDINPLLDVIVEALEKRLDFDRGMIMLANSEKTCLIYTAGFGYNPEHLDYIKRTEFHLSNTESRGTLVVCFHKQTPFLVNDIRDIEKDFSPRSIEFTKRMGTQSFICVPIVFKKKSLGVLVVDNIRSKRLFSQSDLSLLMGIAPQIAISINNAMAYRKLSESEIRFRSLSETAPDIIYTTDTRGAFTYVNPAWERILGHGIDDVLGKHFIDFVREEDVPLYADMFKHIRGKTGSVREGVGELLHKDGSERFFSISGAPQLNAEGRVIGLVGTLKDVSDLKSSESKLQKSYEKLKTALDSTIQAISKIVESRDPFTSGHQERVALLAVAIAEEMELSEELIVSIRMAAKLHDVGKINVPAEILSKPGKLSRIEMEMIRVHPEVGHDILKSIAFPFPISKIVLQHHERMDGSGYPTGAKGNNILMEARILAVADVVESMASHRPYRPACGIEKALDEISSHRGTLYDEKVVDICLRLYKENLFAF